MRDSEFTRILDWPGYRVFRHEIDETAKTLRLWVRRKQGNRQLICSGCGRKFSDTHDYYQRRVRDLPWRKYRATVIIERYRVSCPQCGVRVEKVLQLPSKAPFSEDFEDAVGLACFGFSTSPRGAKSETINPPATNRKTSCAIKVSRWDVRFPSFSDEMNRVRN